MTSGTSGTTYTLEIEPEVRLWLQNCSLAENRAADRLAEDGEMLPFPLSSHLGGPLRELRIGPMRISYWLAPGRLAGTWPQGCIADGVPDRETEQVERAHRAKKVCEAEHAPAGDHSVFDRNEEEQ